MLDRIINFLKTYKKVTISIEEIENVLIGTQITYTEFANIINDLEQKGIIQIVKSKGRNNKKPSLAYQYRIQRSKLQESHNLEIQKTQIGLHPLINLDSYFSIDPSIWGQDQRFILKINHYLNQNPLPVDTVPAPERSFELVGDEKWITEQNGKECLERIGLWEKLKIIPVSDPLMLAVNPQVFNHTEHKHLIVENKTTYQALLDVLPDTPFTSLIYGSGNKILKSVEHLENQLPFRQGQHIIYYFGDIDMTGIWIWHSLNKRVAAKLALPFYRACLSHPYVHGKEYQRKEEKALNAFLSNFTEGEQQQIEVLFEDGGYYPQEVLKTKELRDIWRTTKWM
ncbi:Wadjet anti-phage system protein JetD domain-containing protein [Tepidibacillus marianensis]|uniref:Wadjet anti-phage system protein JetD domain-containing protein n=1 Tax=Tepidibacillus marianensis TaxID=3131995 RepID=UPI0030D0F139